MKYDDLSIRMKSYENVTRTYLMPRSYVFIRVDGRSFHSYLKHSIKPFDDGVISDMDATAIYLCENIQNCKLGYVQSDEITLLLTSFDDINTSQFFDGNIQKISSVVASMATSKFNQLRFLRHMTPRQSDLTSDLAGYTLHWLFSGVQKDIREFKLAEFDCRVWNVPNRWEAFNTFVWRNQDCARNSVSMVAQSLFSHNELHGKSSSQMQEMMFKEHNINWATYDQSKKNGRLIVKEEYEIEQVPSISTTYMKPEFKIMRSRWVSKPAWKFTEDKETLLSMIPKYV